MRLGTGNILVPVVILRDYMMPQRDSNLLTPAGGKGVNY